MSCGTIGNGFKNDTSWLSFSVAMVDLKQWQLIFLCTLPVSWRHRSCRYIWNYRPNVMPSTIVLLLKYIMTWNLTWDLCLWVTKDTNECMLGSQVRINPSSTLVTSAADCTFVQLLKPIISGAVTCLLPRSILLSYDDEICNKLMHGVVHFDRYWWFNTLERVSVMSNTADQANCNWDNT